MLALSYTSRHDASVWLTLRGPAPETVFAGPMPANPFAWDVIGVHPDRYRSAARPALLAADGRRHQQG
ncbi:MAG: hypothetical protein HYY25_12115 [Candidatus Wallbacteria bacterium]|nr:hypothetical protein [Candidatus Wallbacteria bacterium]